MGRQEDVLITLINRAVAHGASFPDVYDWTFGEAVAFINARDTREKEALRMQALMDMTQISTLAKMMSGRAGKLRAMDVYTFLWSKQERLQAKADALRVQLEARCEDNNTKGGV